jgi:hypothetical protein
MTRSTRRTLLALAATASAAVALVGATPAPADTVAPMIKLGPTVVVNGIATVSGTVTALQPSSVHLTVNSHPLGVSAAGAFAGTVDLNGESNLSLTLTNLNGEQVSTITIPLTTNLVGPGGVISPNALSGLEQAAVNLTEPLGGFVSNLGGPIIVTGSVGNPGQLLSLSINGTDVHATLGPGGNYAVPVPGSSKEVKVLMTDRQSVVLETRYPVASAAASPAYVSAENAVGLRIAAIRYSTKRIRSTKRLGIIVTVRDQRGLLVRGAKVSVRSTSPRRVANRTRVKTSGIKGKVTFTMRLRSKAFGKRFVVVASAKTPTAKAAKRKSVRLPRLARSGR